RIADGSGQLGVGRLGLADHGHVSAVARRPERDGLADAAAGASDEQGLPAKCHDLTLSGCMSAHKLGSVPLAPAAWVHRGQGLEAIHCAAIAVVDESSRLTHTLGDPEQVFFARSSINPL